MTKHFKIIAKSNRELIKKLSGREERKIKRRFGNRKMKLSNLDDVILFLQKLGK